MNKQIILILVLIFSFFFRLFSITNLPPALNWDEVSHGYNAYSLLQTGKDEWGVDFPVIFRAYGDYKLPVYIYLTVISEKIFGLNEFAVRLPSVLAGILSVLFVYLLASKLFNKNIGIASALLMGIEPWGLFLSRVAVEANVASFLIIAGVYFFVKGIEKGRWMILSMLLLGLSTHTYNSARVFVPLLIFVLIVIYRRDLKQIIKKNLKTYLLSGLAIVLIYFPVILQLTSLEGQARYRWVNILDEGAINQIIALRGKPGLPEPLPRVFYNKLTYFSSSFIKNYLNSFSPSFFFLKGGSNYQFNIPDTGLIYPSETAFILLGLLVLIKKKDYSSKIIVFWLLLSPIPGSLTKDSPHALRLITMLPIPQILAAIGLFSIYSWGMERHQIRKLFGYGLVGLYFMILSLFFINYWQKYSTVYRENYSWSWQYGYKEAVNYIHQNYSKYDQILITKKYGEPHEFLLFYWPWDPQSFRNDAYLVRYFKSDWYWVDSFDKFLFINDWEIKNKAKCTYSVNKVQPVSTRSSRGGSAKCLLVTSPNNYPQGWRLINTINFLDGRPAFEILTNE